MTDPTLLDLLKQACAPDMTRKGAPPNPHSKREGPVVSALTMPVKVGARLLERPDKLALLLGGEALGQAGTAALVRGMKALTDVGDVAAATRAEFLARQGPKTREFVERSPDLAKIFKK